MEAGFCLIEAILRPADNLGDKIGRIRDVIRVEIDGMVLLGIGARKARPLNTGERHCAQAPLHCNVSVGIDIRHLNRSKRAMEVGGHTRE